MRKINLFGFSVACTILTSCALTPQEERLDFQISLAKECDPVAAYLMARLPKINTLDAQERAIFDSNYRERVNNPTFKICYKQAFIAYSEQQQLNFQKMEWDTNEGFFNNPPFNCEFYPSEEPYWGTC